MLIGKLIDGTIGYLTRHVRDFVHVSDVVEAILLLMSKDISALKPAYDIGTGKGNVVMDLGILAGWEGIEIRDGDPCEAQDNTADITEMKALGWRPKIKVDEYLVTKNSCALMRFASIIPLIGGATIAMENVLQKKPEYILSYEDFKANDKHLVDYYKGKVPYHLYGDNGLPYLPHVEVINTVCPCAGLSSLSPTASGDAAVNDWMLTSANLVLGTLKPDVFWGENAPGLASNIGKPVVRETQKD